MHFSRIELEVFDTSITMMVEDGDTTLFWRDRWLNGKTIKEMAPNLYALIPKLARKSHGKRGAPSVLVDHGHPRCVDLTCPLVVRPTTDQGARHPPDRHLPLEWTTDAQYTSKSCYDFLFEGAMLSSSWRLD